MRGEEGLEKWDDNRERERGRRGIKAWKNRQCQREVWEDQFGDVLQRDTVLSLNGPPRSALPPRLPRLVLHPPTPTCAQSPSHTPPPSSSAKCHTWTIGIHYTQPGTRLLVGWEMFLGHMLKYNPSLRESRGLRLFKVVWIIARERDHFFSPLPVDQECVCDSFMSVHLNAPLGVLMKDMRWTFSGPFLTCSHRWLMDLGRAATVFCPNQLFLKLRNVHSTRDHVPHIFFFFFIS